MRWWYPDGCPPGGQCCSVIGDGTDDFGGEFLGLCSHHKMLSLALDDKALHTAHIESNKVLNYSRYRAKQELKLDKKHPGVWYRVETDGSFTLGVNQRGERMPEWPHSDDMFDPEIVPRVLALNAKIKEVADKHAHIPGVARVNNGRPGKAFMVGAQSGTLALASGDEFSFVGYGNDSATEANTQVSATEAMTFSKMRSRVTAGNSGVATFRFRKNTTNGNQTYTISGVDANEDAVNTDTLAAADLFNVAYTDTGSNSTCPWSAINVEFASGHGCMHGAATFPGNVWDVASSTRFVGLTGNIVTDGGATEANHQLKNRAYTSWEALQVHCTANARTNNSDFTNRINNANGTALCRFSAGASGLVVDTTVGDSLAAGDLVCAACTLLTGVEDLTVAFVVATFKNASASKCEVFCGDNAGTFSRTASATPTYIQLGGFPTTGSALTDAQARIKPGFSGVASNLRCYPTTNSYTGDATLKLMKNGVAVLTVTITAGVASAWFENTADSVSFTNTDEFSFEIDEGTSGTLVLSWAVTLTEVTSVVLLPGLFTNTQTFHAPTVGRGAVNLSPGLFTNTQLFYAPTVALTTQFLQPGLFTNTQTFFAPVVDTGVRFWVGGTADWDGTAGSKWSLTTGGAGGASIPDSTTDVFFDGNSGTGTVTVAAGNTGCKRLCFINQTTFSKFAGTFAGSAALDIYEQFISTTDIAAWTYTGTLTFKNTTSVGFDSSGVTFLGSVVIAPTGGSGAVSLTTPFVSTSTLTFTSGSFTTNNFDVTCSGFASQNINVRTLDMGSSTWTITGTGIAWNVNITNLVLTEGTSTIRFTNNSATDKTFNGGSGDYYNFENDTNGSGVLDIGGANTFNIFDIAKTNNNRTVRFPGPSTQTVTQFKNTAGTGHVITTITGSAPAFVLSDTTGTNSLTNTTISFSTAQGGATWDALSANGNVNAGGNTGWNFGAAVLLPGLFTNSQTYFAPTVSSTYNVTPGLFTNTQTYFAPTVGRGPVNLTPGLFTNSQTYFAPTIGRGPVNVSPGLFTNTQTYFAPTVGRGAVNLSPGLFTNTQTYFAPTVSPGVVNLLPSLFTNSQTYFAPTVTAGAVNILPGLFTNTQTFFAPTLVNAVNLSPGLFTNNQTFFTPTVTAGTVNLLPGLFTNDQIYFAPTIGRGTVNVAPGLFTNSQTFYAPTVTRGAVDLLPGLFTNTQTYFNPSVTSTRDVSPGLFTNSQTYFAPTVLSTYALTPGLFTNNQTFFTPTVQPGVRNLTPGLFTNTQTYFAPTVVNGYNIAPGLFTNTQTYFDPTVLSTYTLLPGLFTNSQTFFAPAVTTSRDIQPGLFTNTQTYFAPTVNKFNTILPGLFTNSQIFYSPTITLPAGTQNIAPGLFTNSQTYFAPTVLSTYNLTPGLFTNSQIFYSPSVSTSNQIQPGLFTNSQTYFAPTVTAGAVNIQPGLFTNGQIFYNPAVTSNRNVFPGLFTNGQTFYSPIITSDQTIFPGLLVNSQIFYGPIFTGGVFIIEPPLLVNQQIFYSPTVLAALRAFYGIATAPNDKYIISGDERFVAQADNEKFIAKPDLGD